MMTVIFGTPEAEAIVTADKRKVEARECRRKSVGQVRCQCRKVITLWAETEEWYQRPHGHRWYHAAYGPGVGHCEACHIFYHEDMDGHLVALRQPHESDNH